MTSREAGDTLRDVPPVVYVPCNEDSDAPGPDGQVPLERGYLTVDGGTMFLGPDAEAVFGRRHFMDLLTTFAMPRQFTVLEGRREVGPLEWRAMSDVDGPIRLPLAGRSWQVTSINWPRHQVQVQLVASRGMAQ